VTSDSAEEIMTALRDEQGISPTSLDAIQAWLDDPALVEFAPHISDLVASKQWDVLDDSFYTSLRVGTGGIRGPLGVGPNRINIRTIGEAAQGLCRFIDDYGSEAKRDGVVVGYEARKQSRDLAVLSCEVFAASGIRSYLFDGLRATPEVSFAVRHLGATAGVQITASHNPRTDNGFKFYWSDGGQVVPPHDASFMEMVAGVDTIDRMPIDRAREAGLIVDIGPELDSAYLNAVRGLSTTDTRSAAIVFSPMHGAGSTNVLPVLQTAGFAVTSVPEQVEPNEEFPTAAGDLINPEFNEVMELPVQLAEAQGADLAICSDPDADRLGVAVKVSWGSPSVQVLTGNQVGAALAHYLLSRRREHGILSEADQVLTTAVTTSLISDIAASFGLTPRDDLLVGFKFIAEIIEGLDDTSKFVFAAEESLGYLAGGFVRDKDAAIASLLVCEMASWLKDRDETVIQYIDGLYREHGYYKNAQYLVELPGKGGRDVMEAAIIYLRAHPPSELAGISVVEISDLLDASLSEPGSYRMGGSTDVVTLYLSEDHRTRVTVRPSGTEPKLKVYVQHRTAVGDSLDVAKAQGDAVAASLGKAILEHCRDGLAGTLRLDWDRSTRRTI
jgi:phosphoglucomutase